MAGDPPTAALAVVLADKAAGRGGGLEALSGRLSPWKPPGAPYPRRRDARQREATLRPVSGCWGGACCRDAVTAVELVSRAGIVVVSHPAEPSRVVPAAARPPTAVPAASRVPTMSTAGAARAARGLWPAGEFRSHVSRGSAEFRSHDSGPGAVRQRPPSRRLRPRPRPCAASPRPPCGRWQSSTGAGAPWRQARTTRCSAGKPSSASSCRGPYAARLVARRIRSPHLCITTGPGGAGTSCRRRSNARITASGTRRPP